MTATTSDRGLMVFCHGLESSPQALKIQWLTPMAAERGWRTVAPSFSGDAAERRDLLLETIAEETGPVALTGSSMGGIVSVMTAQVRPTAGLFLLAPAVYYPGHDHLDHSVDTPVLHIIHGWRDDVIEPDWVIRFAREHQATLSLVDDDHRLSGDRPVLESIYGDFLDALDRAETTGTGS